MPIGVMEPVKDESKELFGGLGDGLKKIGKSGAQSLGSGFKALGNMTMGPMGVLLSVLEAFGVVEPILEIFSGVLEVIGAGILQSLMPAITKLMDILFSPPMMKLWETLGEIIGVTLMPGLMALMIPLEIIAPIIEALGPLLDIVADSMGFLSEIMMWVVDNAFAAFFIGLFWIGDFIANIMDFFTASQFKFRTGWHTALRPLMEQLGIAGLTVGERPPPDYGNEDLPGRTSGRLEPSGSEYAEGGGVTVNIEGNVYGDEMIDVITEAIEEGRKTGYT